MYFAEILGSKSKQQNKSVDVALLHNIESSFRILFQNLGPYNNLNKKVINNLIYHLFHFYLTCPMVQDFGILSKTTTLCYAKEQHQQSCFVVLILILKSQKMHLFDLSFILTRFRDKKVETMV